jgi:hypothetical protein
MNDLEKDVEGSGCCLHLQNSEAKKEGMLAPGLRANQRE